MPSQLAIANLALTKIGLTRISALTDDTERAETIAALWDMCAEDELRKRTWRFSLVRATLAVSTVTPDWGFDYQYPKPGDCLRVVQVGEHWIGADTSSYRTTRSAPFSDEGGYILSNEYSTLPIRYISNAKAVGEWDASFANAFAGRLALELCARLTEAASKARVAQEFYRNALWEAANANALEEPPEAAPDDSFIAAHQA